MPVAALPRVSEPADPDEVDCIEGLIASPLPDAEATCEDAPAAEFELAVGDAVPVVPPGPEDVLDADLPGAHGPDVPEFEYELPG